MEKCKNCPCESDLICVAEKHPRYCELIAKSNKYHNTILNKSRPSRQINEWDFITTEQLTSDTQLFLRDLPPNIDTVVAVARSGLFPGSLISYHLHVPLYSVSRQEGVLKLGHGVRMEKGNKSQLSNILLIDDTVATGKEMNSIYPIVRNYFPSSKIYKAAIYVHPMSKSIIDFYWALYPGCHFLEWNWCNAGHGSACAFDFDGILCNDCVLEDDDDGPRYINFINNVKPLYLPRRMDIPIIVTARQSKYRKMTENWLEKHGIKVRHLIMRDFQVDSRGWTRHIAEYKSHYYQNSKCVLFAESDTNQAKIINQITKRPVLCPKAKRVFHDN